MRGPCSLLELLLVLQKQTLESLHLTLSFALVVLLLTRRDRLLLILLRFELCRSELGFLEAGGVFVYGLFGCRFVEIFTVLG